jgi:hypothetical protein
MDKKVVCRLDDYINGKVNESNICIHKDDVFINDLQGDTLPVATGDGSATSIISTGKSFNRMYDDIRTCNKE